MLCKIITGGDGLYLARVHLMKHNHYSIVTVSKMAVPMAILFHMRAKEIAIY